MSRSTKKEFDAVIVGSGPNGLAAAIRLQQEGLSVLLLEAMDKVGGGMRTAELTLPGFKHDICSAIHPMAIGSPFFRTLPLQKFGLEYIQPALALAHPLDDGSAAILPASLQDTALSLEADGDAYSKLMQPIVENWPLIENDLLSPLRFPRHPVAYAKFGIKALSSADKIAKRFNTEKGKALWAGLAAHSLLPLSHLTTSAIGLVLGAAAHIKGWPVPRGGSQSIANALANYFVSLGGIIQTGVYVKSLRQLPSSHAVLLDVTPYQLLEIAGHRLSSFYRSQLRRYRYGMGVFKVDWALDGTIPFTAEVCNQAGTVHIGNSYEEIATTESNVWQGKEPVKPFVLLAQQSIVDSTRAPAGKHTAWAYCHVPNGSTVDHTKTIEDQIERFAPGFRDRIIGRHTMDTAKMEAYNPNYRGGDILGGAADIRQLFTRPALRFSPYRTSAKGIYICSSSTPPGGGVHGMCGFHAASRAIKDLFTKK